MDKRARFSNTRIVQSRQEEFHCFGYNSGKQAFEIWNFANVLNLRKKNKKLIFLDIIAFMVVNETKATFRHRYTRPLRILIYINFNEGKELRRAIRNVRKTLPDIFNVFALFFLSVFMFSFVGWNLFEGEDLLYANNQTYFANFEDSIWDLYIAVTTANFPDVM